MLNRGTSWLRRLPKWKSKRCSIPQLLKVIFSIVLRRFSKDTGGGPNGLPFEFSFFLLSTIIFLLTFKMKNVVIYIVRFVFCINIRRELHETKNKKILSSLLLNLSYITCSANIISCYF